MKMPQNRNNEFGQGERGGGIPEMPDDPEIELGLPQTSGWRVGENPLVGEISSLDKEAIEPFLGKFEGLEKSPPRRQTKLEQKLSRLEPKNKSTDLTEGIQARIKDPCWLLGRQWQMGEFRAQNGGTPVRTEISFLKRPMNRMIRGNLETPNFDLEKPLEMLAEEEPLEIPAGQEEIRHPLKGWNTERLEYCFNIKSNRGDVELIAKDYNGNLLDWYNFNILAQFVTPKKIRGTEEDVITDISIPPSMLSYRGMPNKRWWAFEDRRIDLGNIKRPTLNYLTMILIEFGLMYSNDWFLIPIKHDVGYIRRIRRFKVMDSFGVVSDVNPVVDPTVARKDWEVFTLSNHQGSQSDGSLFYMPNNLYDGGLESEPIEEVSFLRDELANLVWAIEHKYQDNGKVISRHDEEVEEIQAKIKSGELDAEEPTLHYLDTVKEAQIKSEESDSENITIDDMLLTAEEMNDIIEAESELQLQDEPGNRFMGPLARYKLKSYVPPYWIPYVARKLTGSNEDNPLDGQIILRRGRTKTKLESPENQYKGVMLDESTYVYEEEVPRTGIFLKRTWQLARDINGEIYSWLGRKKSLDMRRRSSGLRFDYLIEK